MKPTTITFNEDADMLGLAFSMAHREILTHQHKSLKPMAEVLRAFAYAAVKCREQVHGADSLDAGDEWFLSAILLENLELQGVGNARETETAYRNSVRILGNHFSAAEPAGFLAARLLKHESFEEARDVIRHSFEVADRNGKQWDDAAVDAFYDWLKHEDRGAWRELERNTAGYSQEDAAKYLMQTRERVFDLLQEPCKKILAC